MKKKPVKNSLGLNPSAVALAGLVRYTSDDMFFWTTACVVSELERRGWISKTQHNLLREMVASGRTSAELKAKGRNESVCFNE